MGMAKLIVAGQSHRLRAGGVPAKEAAPRPRPRSIAASSETRPTLMLSLLVVMIEGGRRLRRGPDAARRHVGQDPLT
jgi:hypothetical protein